jgi:hypothetical protein
MVMKCPNCGGNISIYFTDGNEYDGEYHNYFEGSCYNCGKSYEWEDIYKFAYTTPLYKIDENDHL